MIDAIDKASGITVDESVYNARRFRPEFVGGAEQCRLSVLTPKEDLGLSATLRAALARRIAALNNDAPLIGEFDAMLASYQPDATLLALAAGELPQNERLATLARHTDLVTLTPGEADVSAITRLEQVGLSAAQIVALSELIAFVNFQTRIAAGLRLMRSV